MEKLYLNGPVVTMEAPDAVAEALLVRDGKIAFVGRASEARAIAQDAQVVDLMGHTLMPGFIDGHSHITEAMEMSDFVDLGECTTFDQIVETMCRGLAERNLAPGQPLVGHNYDHNLLGGKHPDRTVLDRVATDRPVVAIQVSAHMGTMNSAALAAAGLTRDTPDPDGGRLGRDPKTGELTGYVEETAMNAVYALRTQAAISTPEEKLARAQELYMKNGITTAQDGASSRAGLEMLSRLGAEGKLKLDVVAYPVAGDDVEETFAMFGERDGVYKDHLKLGGYKTFLDGSPQGRSAWLTKPYVGMGSYCGYPRFTDEVVDHVMEMAVRNNRQILVHCNGDAASDQFLRSYEKALAASDNPKKGELRPVMIHCQTVRDDQLDRMAAIDMIASIFVGHVWYWGDVHMANLGEERGRRVSPVASALERGLHVDFHQDTPVTPPRPLFSAWCATQRVTRSGRVIGPEQRCSVFGALRAITIEGAYAYFEENEKGTLTAGKRADMVVLDHNPLAAGADTLRDIKVLETIKDGETIYTA